VELTVLRAPTDNDGFKLLPHLSENLNIGGRALSRWKAQGLFDRPADQLVTHQCRRHVEHDGSVVYEHTVDVPEHLSDLPRVGVRFGLPGRFRHLRWYGRGPHENYPDRNASALVSVWEGPVDALPYLVPQEFGLRTDTRWLECLDPDAGEVLRVDVLRPATLHVSATNHTAEDLYAAANVVDLEPLEDLIISLDVAHRGLGTASCGPDVAPEFRLGTGRFRFAYRLSRR
jgi:beta-galactosidase